MGRPSATISWAIVAHQAGVVEEAQLLNQRGVSFVKSHDGQRMPTGARPSRFVQKSNARRVGRAHCPRARSRPRAPTRARRFRVERRREDGVNGLRLKWAATVGMGVAARDASREVPGCGGHTGAVAAARLVAATAGSLAGKASQRPGRRTVRPPRARRSANASA
jgi:hypothetical protein